MYIHCLPSIIFDFMHFMLDVLGYPLRVALEI